MKNFKEFKIPFIGLKEGEHTYQFEIDKKFFDSFGFEDFNDAIFQVDVVLAKKSTMMELHFHAEGQVNVPCDVSGEDFDLKVKDQFFLVVKFGESFDNSDDELLILPHGAYEIELQQYIYELLVLAVPQKRVKKGAKLESDQTLKSQNKIEHKSDIDPRWDQLKKLLGK